MKVLSSAESFSLKQQLTAIREQIREIEERGVYDVAGNIVRKEDRQQFNELRKMEHHVRQLAAGVERPAKLEQKKRKLETPKDRLSDEEWKELAEWAHEAFKPLLGCTDTGNEKESCGDAVEAQETHVTDGD